MVRNLTWRFIVVLVVILTGTFFLVPSLTDSIPFWWKDNVQKIHLGLDLQGGTHLLTEVQTDVAVENTLHQYVQTLEELLDENKIPFIEVTVRNDQNIAVELVDQSANEKLMKIMKDNFPSLKNVNVETGENVYRPVFAL